MDEEDEFELVEKVEKETIEELQLSLVLQTTIGRNELANMIAKRFGLHKGPVLEAVHLLAPGLILALKTELYTIEKEPELIINVSQLKCGRYLLYIDENRDMEIKIDTIEKEQPEKRVCRLCGNSEGESDGYWDCEEHDYKEKPHVCPTCKR